jgi:gamma-glutamyltranspeptidase/glutathione hydrolase
VTPWAASLEKFRDRGWEPVPERDIWAQLMPASPDVLVSLLADHGTMSFAQLAAPAIELARGGFPIHEVMAYNLDFSLVERIGFQFILPENAKVYTKGEWWRPSHVGDRFQRPDLAATFERLADAEADALAGQGIAVPMVLKILEDVDLRARATTRRSTSTRCSRRSTWRCPPTPVERPPQRTGAA